MGEWICLSLNDFVKFKLNEAGRKKWLNELKVARDAAPEKAKKHFSVEIPEPDEKGFHELQMFEVMNLFGSIMGNGMEPPIEIRILVKPMEDSDGTIQ